MTVVPVRGQIYQVDVGYGVKPWLIVSNNRRNRKLSHAIAVRIVTTDKHVDMPTWVSLGVGDPLAGYIDTDDIHQLRRDDLGKLLGALAPRTLMQVNEALQLALALP